MSHAISRTATMFVDIPLVNVGTRIRYPITVQVILSCWNVMCCIFIVFSLCKVVFWCLCRCHKTPLRRFVSMALSINVMTYLLTYFGNNVQYTATFSKVVFACLLDRWLQFVDVKFHKCLIRKQNIQDYRHSLRLECYN